MTYSDRFWEIHGFFSTNDLGEYELSSSMIWVTGQWSIFCVVDTYTLIFQFPVYRNYTSVDPKQFNKQNQTETSDLVKYKKAATSNNTQPHMMGAKGSQDHFRAQEGGHTNQHQGGQV